MPNFTPAGIVRIGRVPFDNSYRNTLAWQSKADQESYFASVCTKRLEKDSYTYVRMNNSIKVPFNAEELYTYNYVMYQNANYGSKWFYAFIVGVNYVNKSTTELVLELDVMQTWFFDYHHNQCFVEREHVSDDTIGAHLNPEPDMPFNQVVKAAHGHAEWFRDNWVVVQTNAWPVLYAGAVGTDPHYGMKAVSGGFYQRVFNGCKYYAFELGDGDHDYGTSKDGIFWFLDAINASGGAESVSNVFMFPKAFAPARGDDKGLEENTDPILKTDKVSMPTSLGGGYVPRNNKLFTFPYCYPRVTDLNGNYTEWRYEYWRKEADGGMRLGVQTNLDPSATVFVVPFGYMGLDVNRNQAFTFPLETRCSWVYSSYQTWSAQNALANMLSVAADIAMMAVPAAKGLSAAVKGGKAAASAAGTLATGIKAQHTRNRTALARYAKEMDSIEGTSSMGFGDLAAGAAGIMGLANLAGTVDRMSKVPNTSKGQSAGNSRFANEFLGYSVEQVVIDYEFAVILDKFLDMYGYQVDLVGRPNWNNRRNWNYIKCSGANHSGNVPAEDMALINSIYDQGFTYWHDPATYGDYAQPNDIVSR